MYVTSISLLSTIIYHTIILVSASQECGWWKCDKYSYCDTEYKECQPCSGICYHGTKYEPLCKTHCPYYPIPQETTSTIPQETTSTIPQETTSTIDQASRDRIENSTLEFDSITIVTEESNERKVNILIGILVPFMFIMFIALLYLCKGQRHASNIIKSWRGKLRTTSETDPEAPEHNVKESLMKPKQEEPLVEPKNPRNALCPPGGTKPGDLPKAKDEKDEKLDTSKPPVTNIPPSDLTSTR